MIAFEPAQRVETTDFYQLRVERHQKAATVITSNRTPKNPAPPETSHHQ